MPSKSDRFDIGSLIRDELGKNAPIDESGAMPLSPADLSPSETAEQGTAERREKNIEELLASATEKASDRLRAVILASFPERLESETEHAAIEAELRRVMTDLLEMSSDENNSNRPIVAKFEGRDNPAVYKPVEREAGNQQEVVEFCRYGIPPGTYARREWLAYMIDRALGLAVVPTVVLRDGPYGMGSVQDWRGGDKAFDRKWIREAKHDEFRREQLARLGLFDASAHNTDRMSHNWLISPEGKHWAIDNSLILPTEVGRRRVEELVNLKGRVKFDFNDDLIGHLLKNRDRIRSYPLWVVGNQPLPEHLAKQVGDFLGNAEIQRALKDAFDLALEEESDEAWRGFTGSLVAILRDGLPENGWHEEDFNSSRFE